MCPMKVFWNVKRIVHLLGGIGNYFGVFFGEHFCHETREHLSIYCNLIDQITKPRFSDATLLKHC